MKSKKKSTVRKSVVFFFLISGLIACTTKEVKKIEKEAYNAIESEIDCLIKPSWFPHDQTPPPLEGQKSPFANGKTVTNLNFHQWSWQKFLWLTKPLKNENSLPLFLVQDSIIQIDDAMGPLVPFNGASVVLIYNQQACSNGVLKTNPAYNKENNNAERLYYSLHTSPTMMKAKDEFLKGMKLRTINEKLNYETFPVASLELKVSWVEIEAIPKEKRSLYYTTIGAISNENGIFENKKVAMLGMHVVGVVENHPEFIWATFEHKDMAPNYNWKSNSASSNTEKLLFKEGSTTGINGIDWIANDTIKKTGKIIPGHAKEASVVYDLFQYGVPLNSDGNYMITSQAGKTNFDNINDINVCVSKHLKDVWKNYYYNGSIWIDTEDYETVEEQAKLIVDMKFNISSALPKGTVTKVKDSLALGLGRGSLNCANVTMETFTQTFNSSLKKINVNNVANCFSCHSSPSFKDNSIVSPLYLSHIFDAAVQQSNGSSAKEIEIMKNKQSVLHFLNK
jgi:hypothetical protein